DAHSMIRKLAEAKTPALPMHLIELFEDLRDRAPPDYFPHEFLNSGWEPLWSAHVRREMSHRGLTYLGQAELERQRPDLSLNSAQRSALEDVHEQNTWDTLFDVLVDTPFRIDLYGRDPQSADLAAMDQIWLSARKGANAKLIAKTPAGSLKFDNLAARGMLDALQGGPMQLQDLGGQLGLGMADVRNAADCLIMGNIATLCAPPSSTHMAEALNWRLSAAACRPEGTPIAALAGRHGPIRARAADIGLLDQSVEGIVAAARQHEALKARYFADEADLNDAALLSETRDAQLAVRSDLARRGVPVRDL
ncbi:MAG: methyltransferase regulatory domain-containing protein, partial [Paracoccaceae bacterium]